MKTGIIGRVLCAGVVGAFGAAALAQTIHYFRCELFPNPETHTEECTLPACEEACQYITYSASCGQCVQTGRYRNTCFANAFIVWKTTIDSTCYTVDPLYRPPYCECGTSGPVETHVVTCGCDH